jgi:hypothetical protein
MTGDVLCITQYVYVFYLTQKHCYLVLSTVICIDIDNKFENGVVEMPILPCV